MSPANPHAEDESQRVISPFAQTTSTVRASNSGRGKPWPLWIVSILLILVVVGMVGYFTAGYLRDPYRTLEPFPVDKYMSDYRALTGAKFRADLKVSADLGWKADVGRLMIFVVANDSRPVVVLIPPRLGGIFFTKGQNYRASLEVGEGGLIYADAAKRNSLLVFLFSLGAGLSQAAPPANSLAPAPDAPSAASASTSATAPVDNSTATTLDYLFNHRAGQGTAAKAGAEVAGALADKIKAVDVLKTPGLDDPIVRARFETYLSLQAVPDDRIKDYFNKMGQISDTLRTGDSFGAWKILFGLGDYKDIDAGISRELANRVEAIWNTSRTANGLEMANDKLRNNIETYNHNADLLADDLKRQEQDDQRKGSASHSSSSSGGSNSSAATTSALINPNADPTAAEAAMMPTMGSSLQGKMQLTSEYLNLLEARAKIKLNEIREHKMDDEGKTDFAKYIKTLFDTHRYYHVIIGADFYRALFNEGEYPVDMANEVNVALETNNQVSQAIEVFRYKAQKNEIAAAAGQLQAAFIGNEFHPGLQGLPRDEKEKVGDFLAKLDVLKNQLESRDFEQVEGQIAAIKKVAADFDATKPLALVNGVKLESRLRLGKAKLLAQGGQLNLAMQEFQTAAEEWPGNPDLQTSATGFFSKEDVQNQSTDDFDRLVQEQNYRGIFDKQLPFALAVKGDSAREQQLKDALLKVQKAEMASEKANLLVMNGDVDGAWETIETAVKVWPDDMKLNKLLADLSGRSADFVSAINHAREAEAKKEMGYSLTWYVNAQNLYPASVIALDGIERIRKQLLSPDATARPAAN